jgi:chloramphenicol 3-O phosphotransferase
VSWEALSVPPLGDHVFSGEDDLIMNGDHVDFSEIDLILPGVRRLGRIILLNGTSSSGKSSIAAELLELLDPPHFHLAVDAFGAMRGAARTGRLNPEELAATLTRTRAGFHRAVAGMAAAGNDLVIDHVLSEPWRLPDLLAVLAPFDVVFVGVHCELAELRRRELARGDRAPGAAQTQFPLVHVHGDYDVEVDTTTVSARECAERIVRYLGEPRRERAFERLRSAVE